MTVTGLSEELARLVGTRPDWFDWANDRLPLPILRHVAASPRVRLSQSVTAVMEIAHRCAHAVPGPRS